MLDHDRPDADGIDPEENDDDLPVLPLAGSFPWAAGFCQ